ncbi:MAG: transcriptional repressor, partial [Actinomycetota bacterium]|nr:transcriptional repressor [Actinomycetota bacterium]
MSEHRSAAEERTRALFESLRARGERLTTARRALLAALAHAHDHRTADQLAAEVKDAYPAIHRATIYRTLETLRRLGVVEHSHLGHGPAVYHLADDVHHHLVCEGCGAVTEATPSLFTGLETALREEYGFEMESRHFAVTGRCRDCAA